MAEAKAPEVHDRQETPGEEKEASWLDRRLDLTWLNLPVVIFVLLLIIAALLRFWDLGSRAMHHDESIHAWFSWRFYTGEQLYRYDPMFHGPFLYHITALFFFLFGDSDAVARAPEALAGVFLVAMCYPLRRWLGRWGWLIAAALFTFSPAFVYFFRFARHDALAATFALATVLMLFRYLEEQRPRDLVLAAAALALALASHELTWIIAFILLSFLGLSYLLDWQGKRLRAEGRMIAGGAMALSFLLTVILGRFVKNSSLAQGLLIVVFLLALGYLGASYLWPRLFPRGISPVHRVVRTLVKQPRPLLTAVGVLGLIFALLFTTLLTHPRGFVDGLIQGLSYWAGQQQVQRGGQPWFYYLVLLPVYEPIALLAGLAGFGWVLSRIRRRHPSVPAGSGEAWPDPDVPPTPDARPARYRHAARGEAAPGPPAPGEELATARRQAEVPAGPFIPALLAVFLAYWGLLALALFSWAGEKMPWLLLQVALPLVLLAGLALDRLVAWVSWRVLWRSGDWAIGPLFLLLAFALGGLVNLFRGQTPHQLANQYLDLQKGVLIIICLALVAVLAWRIYRVEGRHLGQSFALLGLVLLAVYTIRSTFLLNFYYGDTPREMLVYTQTAPDVPLVVRQIERLSLDRTRQERTAADPAGGHGLKVALDTSQALDWPFRWYLRDFDRAGTLTLFDASLEAPPASDIVLVLAANEPAVRPYLQGKYTGMRLKHRWWFPEFATYKRWTLLTEEVTEYGYPTMPWLLPKTYSQQGLSNLWDYLIFRRLPYPLESQDFYLYVRSDLLPAGTTAAQVDPYIEKLAPRTASGFFGSPGSGPGQLSLPRGIALDPSGRLFVADSGNHRIVRFDAQGQSLEWGSGCSLSGEGLPMCEDPDGPGPLPQGAGQFNEPWGVAVDAQGRVYVADTWNHRIQVFDANGAFLGQWGEGRLVDLGEGERAESPYGFYGPRGLAVDPSGRLYVTDTGNERVLVYAIHEESGGRVRAEYLYQWGTIGPQSGQFLEPVGIAVDPSGRVYVADTWNQRIQVFAPGADGRVDPQAVVTWPVTGWESNSRENKPYLAVSPGGQVYFTVPERFYVAVTDGTGNILTVWGQYGTGLDAFNYPIGLAIDAAGQVYVSDAGNGRVLVFARP